MQKLFLLDAYALIYRSYYAFIKNPRINSKGLNTSAIMGFLNTLQEVLTKEQPTHIGVAFDPHGPTFRSEAYPAYKAQREATPEDIKQSVPIIKDLLRAWNIHAIPNTAQLLNITRLSGGGLPPTPARPAIPWRNSIIGAGYDLTDTLIESAEMLVFFDGVDTVFFDTKDGEWTDTRTGNSYQAVVDNASLIYVDEDGLPYQPLTLPNKATEPAIPTRSGYTFVGWTTRREAADCDRRLYLPGTSEADHIQQPGGHQDGMLWDFNTHVSEGHDPHIIG